MKKIRIFSNWDKRKTDRDKYNLSEVYEELNCLINNDKIKFNFYKSCLKLDLLQCCYNQKENIIELSFRNRIKEYIEELKELKEKPKVLDDFELKCYVDKKIDDNYYLIEQKPYYQDRRKQFDDLYDNLYSKLSSEDRKTLEEITSISSDIASLENCIAYYIGKSENFNIII